MGEPKFACRWLGAVDRAGIWESPALLQVPGFMGAHADMLCCASQGLEAHAEDMAIEDIILALDRALQAEKAGLTVDQYLKQVVGAQCGFVGPG